MMHIPITVYLKLQSASLADWVDSVKFLANLLIDTIANVI